MPYYIINIESLVVPVDIIFKHEKPLYIELYLALEDMINKGILKPDTKMPSKRFVFPLLSH